MTNDEDGLVPFDVLCSVFGVWLLSSDFWLLTSGAVRRLFPFRSLSNSLALHQCAAFIEKSELTTGGSLPQSPFPSFLNSIIASASRKILLPQLAYDAHLPA